MGDACFASLGFAICIFMPDNFIGSLSFHAEIVHWQVKRAGIIHMYQDDDIFLAWSVPSNRLSVLRYCYGGVR